MWIPAICLRRGNNAGCCEHGREPSGNLLAAQRLCSMELVSLCEVLKQNVHSEEQYIYPRHQNVCVTKTSTYWWLSKLL